MKRLTFVLLAGALAALILQPISVEVNTNSSKNKLWADGGMPIPPVPPNFQLAGGGESA